MVLPTAVDLTSRIRWVTRRQDENLSRRSSLNDESISSYLGTTCSNSAYCCLTKKWFNTKIIFA